MMRLMKSSFTLFSALLLLIVLCAPRVATAQDVTAFVNVNVLPMDAERVLNGQTVIVRDGIIAEMGPAAEVSVPAGAIEVDGTGRYLMPGLAEMHGHVPGADNPQFTEDMLFLYVSNGVTTVRNMAGDPYHLELRERILDGSLLGPTIYAAGPGFGGSWVSTPEQAEARVREQHEAGYDLLKIFDMPEETYHHMASVAHEVGIDFAGHIPASVGLSGALEARQRSIDHLDRYVEFLVPDPSALEGREIGFFGSGVLDLVDESRIPLAVQATIDAGTWNVPTLSLVEHHASLESPEEMIQRPEMRYIPPGMREAWRQAKHNFQNDENFWPNAQEFVELRRKLTRELHAAGAPIVLGSDAPQWFNVPGFSIHHELRMMVDAGLTPYEVLTTGTRNAGVYFGLEDEFGTIAPGLRADLILLEANPLNDIGNVQQRAGVMVRGHWLPEAEIQTHLDEIAARMAE